MFGSPFNRDYSRRTPMPSAYVYSDYPASNQTPYHHTYDPPRQHRHTPRQHPPPRYHSPPPPHHRRLPRRPSHYSDISPSPSEHDTPDEIRPYYMMPSGDPHANIPPQFRQRRNHSPPPPPTPSPPPSTNTTSLFRPFHARVTPRAAQKLGKDEILILPPLLTRLRVQMRSSLGNETLRVNVAGDMPFRDVVKQLLPESELNAGTKAWVKMRGAWLEAGCVLVSQIVEQGRFVLNERGEVEVKIEIGGGGRQRVRDV